MVPHYWKVVLMDHDDADYGDVATQGGEFIGAWSIDEQGWYAFVPDGEQLPTVVNVGVGRFCNGIAEWVQARPVAH